MFNAPGIPDRVDVAHKLHDQDMANRTKQPREYITGIHVKSKSRTLGPLISRHPLRRLSGGEVVFLVLLGSASTFSPLLAGYDLYIYGYTKFGPVAAEHWSRPWYLITLFALLIFQILVFLRIRQAHRYVALHQHGLHMPFASPITLFWENIAGVSVSAYTPTFFGKSLSTRYQAHIFPTTGKPIFLPASTSAFPELLTQIKAHIYPRLLPELQSNFEGGKWIFFGPVSIHSGALRISDRQSTRNAQTIPWKAIKHLSIHSGRLVVEFIDGASRKLPLGTIPNIEILLQIVKKGVST
jgi:hypothetical protein